jgi:hypothetical protein
MAPWRDVFEHDGKERSFCKPSRDGWPKKSIRNTSIWRFFKLRRCKILISTPENSEIHGNIKLLLCWVCSDLNDEWWYQSIINVSEGGVNWAASTNVVGYKARQNRKTSDLSHRAKIEFLKVSFITLNELVSEMNPRLILVSLTRISFCGTYTSSKRLLQWVHNTKMRIHQHDCHSSEKTLCCQKIAGRISDEFDLLFHVVRITHGKS